MTDKYILEGHNPVICENLIEWAKWFEKSDRKVAKTKIKDVTISTVFLGINHNFGEGKPILFETMIFGGGLDGEMDRYSTWEEAEEGHKRWIKKIKELWR